ncbi:NACHT domain-containing protein [Nonomuraea sp. NPDC050556]|uniref:NACHT N-terminal Helical domain 1-containing protein n=1 Tax=Nonomuraea sp. NPDC050556 TaxID=3364369 RepID=UPI0037A9D41A
MAAPDNAIVDLATAIVKASCFLLTGDVSDAAATIADLVKGRVNDVIERRQIERTFDACADVVAHRLRGLVDSSEYRRLPSNERAAAVLAATDTMVGGALDLQGLIAADLDAVTVGERLRPSSREVLGRARLSSGGVELYRLVLRESCDYLVEAATTFPQFQAESLRALLGRQTSLDEQLREVLARLPSRRAVDDFEVDYRRALVNRLDRMELFGVTRLGEASRHYPLSVAYLSLGVATGDRGITGTRVEDALSGQARTLIAGEAGSGKTTLLRWLAVRAATDGLGGSLAGWNGCVPFFIPLRRYSDQPLPTPARFVETVAANHTADMPPGWVNGLLRAGRALVLVDGVDEVHEGERREEVRRWLEDLMADFPAARYVITSRTAALDDSWRSLDRTPVATLQPMSRSDVREFVGRWHEAMNDHLTDAADRDALADDKGRLLASIDHDRHVRQLAVSPLLAALLCALNREGSGLPQSRMEVYDAALSMLLGGRDRARGVPVALEVAPPLQRVLLAELAYWLVMNGWSDVPVERAAEKLGRIAATVKEITADGETLLRYLLERSGLLREPVQGRVDFVHKTFQEYLAGWAAMRADDVGQLIAHAGDDQWRDVTVMAAGHATLRQANELVGGVLERGSEELALLAVACAQAARQLDAGLLASAQELAAAFIPPRDLESAEVLAPLGDFMLELLEDATDMSDVDARWSVHAAALTRSPDAFPLIVRLARRCEAAREAAIDCWSYFAPDGYFHEVVSNTGPHGYVFLTDPAHAAYLPQLKELRHLNWLLRDRVADLNILGACDQLESLTLSGAVCDLVLPQALRYMYIMDAPFLELGEELPELTALRLDGCPGVTDLRALRRCPTLTEVTLIHIGTRDISPLAALPDLRRLELGGFSNVSLAPFAGKTDLMIVVHEDTTVSGKHALGPGSSIQQEPPY